MMPLLELTLKMSLLLGVSLLVASRLARRSAAASHLMLAAGLLSAAALPVVQVVAPSWSLPALSVAVAVPEAAPEVEAVNTNVEEVSSTGSAATKLPSPSREPWSSRATVFVGWGLGSVLVVLPLAIGLFKTSVLRRHAMPVNDERILTTAAAVSSHHAIARPVTLLHAAIPILATWGWRRPVVFLPAEATSWSDSRLRIVLAHELAHVRRGDSPLQTIAGLLRAALWFNPLAWIMARRLRDESERACDDLVIDAGVDPADYADELLALARCQPPSPSWMSAPAMARPCSLERRVAAMFDERLNRKLPSRSFRVAVTLALVVLTAAVGGYRAMAQGFATFSGQVQDAHGGHLGGVTLTLTNRASGQKYEVKSSATGAYEIVGVTPGDYELQAWRAGFRTHRSTRTIGGGTVKEQVMLQVGSLEETISVTGGGGRDKFEPVVAANAARTAFVPVQSAKPAALERPCEVPAEGGQIRQPMKVKDVRPVYPEALAAALVGETMVFKATIATDGSVREVVPIKAENPELSSAAIEAIRQWRYTVTLLNCQPIEVEMSVAVSFKPE